MNETYSLGVAKDRLSLADVLKQRYLRRSSTDATQSR